MSAVGVLELEGVNVAQLTFPGFMQMVLTYRTGQDKGLIGHVCQNSVQLTDIAQPNISHLINCQV